MHAAILEQEGLHLALVGVRGAQERVVQRVQQVRHIAVLVADSSRGNDGDERLAAVLGGCDAPFFEQVDGGDYGGHAGVAEVWLVDCEEGRLPSVFWGCA